jgi:hypothetical protein
LGSSRWGSGAPSSQPSFYTSDRRCIVSFGFNGGRYPSMRFERCSKLRRYITLARYHYGPTDAATVRAGWPSRVKSDSLERIGGLGITPRRPRRRYPEPKSSNLPNRRFFNSAYGGVSAERVDLVSRRAMHFCPKSLRCRPSSWINSRMATIIVPASHDVVTAKQADIEDSRDTCHNTLILLFVWQRDHSRGVLQAHQHKVGT